MKSDERVIGKYPNFDVLARRCPACGDSLIRNHTGIECGSLGCNYGEGNSPIISSLRLRERIANSAAGFSVPEFANHLKDLQHL